MSYEIERKFLIKDNSWKSGLTEAESSFIQQGYLSDNSAPTVRVRIKDSQAWITIKGKTEGIVRSEFEYQIPNNDALELMKMAISGIIIKRRYEVFYKGKKWEVDEFFGDNEGLILAEIELEKEDESFIEPPWLGEEVSQDARYYNSKLAINPFKKW